MPQTPYKACAFPAPKCFAYQGSTPLSNGQPSLVLIGHSVQAIIFPYIVLCTHELFFQSIKSYIHLLEKWYYFGGKFFSSSEALRVKHHLSNQLSIRLSHSQ